MSIQLSPATRRGMFNTLLEQEREQAARKNPTIETVVMYLCPREGCGEMHEYKDDAIDCCAGEDDVLESCPVCNAAFATHRDAADCCLWHDLDAPTRWAIADKVEAGATWAEAIAAATEN